MLAGPDGPQRHRGMKRVRFRDVDRVDFRVSQECVEIAESAPEPELAGEHASPFE